MCKYIVKIIMRTNSQSHYCAMQNARDKIGMIFSIIFDVTTTIQVIQQL